MKKKRVSSEDVARYAGVSRTTVSFVLNNTPGKNISEETRQRVLQAAAELEYTPNENARRLAMTRHTSVGLFIRHSKSVYSDVYVIRLVEGMAQVLNRHRFRLLIQPVYLERGDYLSRARTEALDGIVLLNTHDDDPALDEVVDMHFPLVVVGSVKRDDVYQVSIDNRSAAADAVRYLSSLGHRKIAMITQSTAFFTSTRERIAGYREAMREAGNELCDKWVMIGDFSEQSGFDAMNRLLELEDRPTAVFAAADTLAYGAMKAVREAGLTIPGDLSLVGFDDDYLSRYTTPPLTTVSIPISGLGAAAADLLIKRLSGRELPVETRMILPTHLAKRSSCAAV